ncbi:hypothetical protein Tco_0174931 [Tanacetum coccineum]
MAKSNQLYDVKIFVRSTVKLLKEIKLLLERNPTRERLFRRTVFGRWLDILSHDSDNHLMHYVLHHQVFVSKIPFDCPLMIFHIGDHWLQFRRKEFCLITGFRFGLSGMDAVRVCLIIVAELVFMDIDFEELPKSRIWWSKKDNVLPRGIAWSNVTKFQKNDYNRLFGPVSNPILKLYATASEMKESWFIASINFINGLVDEDMNVSQDDGAGVVNCVDFQHNSVLTNSILSANSHEGLNDQLFLDSDGCAKNPVTDKDKQPTMAEIFAEIRALRKEVALVKVDDEIISKLERLVNQIVVNEGNGVASDGMPIGNADGNHAISIVLHTAVNQGLGVSSNDPMSSSCPADIDNGEVVSDGMPISNADGNHDIGIVLYTAVNQGLGVSSNDPMSSSCPADIDNDKVAGDGIGIVDFDGKNDILNDNPNSVNQVFGGSANHPMSTCSLTDMDNGEVACDGMVIDNADEKNEYTYSQRASSTLDVLIKALDSANDNPGFDVLQHDNAVDRSVAELNHHPTADIHVHDYEFVDDYMSVLNEEEHEENHDVKYSLDEMKLIDEDEKLIVKDPPVKQHVDAFIDEQEDKTTVFLENVKVSSFFKDDYKPCLASVFSNIKPKRKKRGFERNYVFRSVKERKRRLSMSLDSSYGQQASTTPALPKTRSQNVNGDFIAALKFEEKALHNAIMEAGSKDRPPMLAPVPVAEGSSETTTERYMENYKNVSQDIRDQLNDEAEVVQIILTGIDNDIYSTVDACPNACEMWKAIERLKQGESINVQDLETNLYWEFGKFTSRDGESLESYYSRFYKMMNELVRNQCHVTNHQVNVQFLLQLQPEWQRFVTLVKQSQELKTVSYHKLYDILKQHQNEVNEIRAERLARTANPLALVAQQQPVYHHQNHPTQNTQYSSTRSQQSTRNRGKAIVTSSAPTYDPEPATVTEDEEMSKEKEIDKLMALISLSFKKIYKPTNNNLRTSSNTSRANQDNSPRINRGTGYDNQRAVNVAGARENVGTLVVQKSGIHACIKGMSETEKSKGCSLSQGKDAIVKLLNGTSLVVSKSFAVHAADNPDKRQQHNTTHTSITTDVADPPPLNI